MIPVVSTTKAIDAFATTCTFLGEIRNTGGLTITRRGFVYVLSSTESETPRIGESGVFDIGDNGTFSTGKYFSLVSGLTNNKAYRFCAYAVNSDGVGYGETMDVKTITPLVNQTPYIANSLIVWYVMAKCMEQDRNIQASNYYLEMFYKEMDYLIRGNIKGN